MRKHFPDILNSLIEVQLSYQESPFDIQKPAHV